MRSSGEYNGAGAITSLKPPWGKGHAVVHQYHQPSAEQDGQDVHAGHSTGGAGHGAHH